MPIPFTKVYLSAATSSATGGYRLLANAPGDFSLTFGGVFPATPWLSGLSDINADGVVDTIVGAPGDDDKAIDAGRIFINWGTTVGGTSAVIANSTAGFIIDGVNAGDKAGAAVGTVADLNADGKAEVLVGAPGMENGAATDAGAAFVVWGKASGGVDLADLFSGGGQGYVIKGQAAGDAAGAALNSISDLNGDGKAEIIVGAPGSNASGADSGAAYVVFGKSTSSIVNLSTVATGAGGFRIVGEAAGDSAGQHVDKVADLNGDGKAEILIGATGNDQGGNDAGAVYIVFGKSTGTQVNLANVGAGTGGFVITGRANQEIGSSFSDVGDINGDGKSDIFVGVPNDDRAYVVFGKSTTSEVRLRDISDGLGGGFEIKGENAGDLLDLSITGGADFNHDGVADIVIGTPHNDEGGADAGAVYVVWGGGSGMVDLALVAQGMGGAKIVGDAGSLTGASVAILNDMNADAEPELLIGSPGSDSVSVLFGDASWQPDINVYGTEGADVMGPGYGDVHKIGDGADNIIAIDGDDTIDAAGGDDIIDGGAGADAMTGGLGDDTYYVDAAGDTTIEISGGGVDTVIASINHTLADNVENLTLDGFGGVGVGNGLDNTLTGTAGADSLDGGAGADHMIGGFGNDSYVVDTIGDDADESTGGATDFETVTASIDYTLGSGLERLVLSGAAVNGTGNELANTLVGNALANTLDGAAGADNMSGGGGDDVYLVDNAGDTIDEAGGGGADTVIAGVNYTLGNEVETLQLTGAARIGTGNAGANHLIGTSGADTLDGAGGADTMSGGLGDDIYKADNLGDIVDETGGDGIDTVIASIDGYALGGAIENLTLSGAARRGVGNALANTLTGTAGADTLNGAGGADIMAGGLGNDVYHVDELADTIDEALSAGADTVIAAVDGYTLGANVETLTLAGGAVSGNGNALDNTLTGNALGNTLSGGEGADTIDGLAGGDTMIGGLGDDTYYVDDVNDVIVEAVDGGSDTVVVNADWTLTAGSNIENVRVTGTGHIVTGNAGANTLSGGAGDDTLDGGAGDDTELGGGGHDRLISRSGHDKLSGGEGDDVYEIHGGEVEIEDFLGHDSIDASHSSGDSHIDLSGETTSDIDGHSCTIGQGGTTVAPLDVQFLQDLTGSFADDIATVRTLVPQIVSALQTVQTNARFGVSSFVDKAVSPFGAFGEWVYKLELGMTNVAASLAATYNAITTNNGMDTPESQIESLMHLALTTGEVGFRADSARFVVLFTDAPFHVAGDGAAAGITTPNNGDAILDGVTPGTGEDYPAIAQLRSALEAANIIPIFAVTADVTAHYNALVTSLGRGATVALSANSANIVTAITDGLTQVTKTVIEDATGGSGDDVIKGNDVDNTLTGNAGSDTLYGHGQNDKLYGLADDDVLDGGSGDDLLDGGLGVDTGSYASATSGVTISLAVGTAQATGAGADTLISIENIVGSAFNDIFTGARGVNVLDGGLGDDRLNGDRGADRLIGGLGNDSYTVDNIGDAVVENFGEGADSVISYVNYTLSANVEKLTLAGKTNINGTGNILDNILTGNSAVNILDGGLGDDRLAGGLGADRLIGGLGNDRYTVDASDIIVENAGEGTDTVWSSLSYTLTADVENLTLGGVSDIIGTGNELANTLTGNAGANVLDGGLGVDRLYGGAGADTLIGGAGNDVLIGGLDADIFVFKAAGAPNGLDRLNDFVSGVDTLRFTASEYGFAAGHVLSAGEFTTGSAAVGSGSQFVWNATTSALSWDADGAGGAAGIRIATLQTGAMLLASDLVF